jgi:hypothetical protein
MPQTRENLPGFLATEGIVISQTGEFCILLPRVLKPQELDLSSRYSTVLEFSNLLKTQVARWPGSGKR